MSEDERWSRVAVTFIFVVCISFFSVMFKAYLNGRFDSIDTLRLYIQEFGYLAPVVLTLIQAMQVIVPIIPGFFGCAVGAILFGSMGGFIINYIGICLGSLGAFMAARKYGEDFVNSIFNKEKYIRWANRASDTKSYTWFLLFTMIMPLFPDDFFCFFTGLGKMSFKKFALIIFLGKPWCILAYSYGFAFLLQ
ncbi:MAG: TVP38/TMEM64 family protein [Lachnospiraceae bacterium]|nr:TVP38/TMEM64 family protein [Lachnospiraceae bacterium]